MKVTTAERRIAQRLAMRVPMMVCIWKSAVPEQRAESLNISERGVLFATASRFREGECVELSLEMPEEIVGGTGSQWRCVGHVVRVQGLDYASRTMGVGVQFDTYQMAPSAKGLPELRRNARRFVKIR